MTTQYIILKHIPTLIFDILTKVSGDEHTFMVQDMSQEMMIKIFDIGMNSEVTQVG
jgi:hypothetical protein